MAWTKTIRPKYNPKTTRQSDPTGTARQASEMAAARDRQCDPLHATNGLSVVDVAELIPTQKHHPPLRQAPHQYTCDEYHKLFRL